jgi:hypothetical protein
MMPARKAARRRRQAILTILLCGPSITGCYRSVELASPQPEPNARVIVDLGPAGAEQMARWIGPEAVEIEGQVVRWDDAEAELALLRVDHRGSRSVLWNGERVIFPAGSLRDVRQRRLDTGRTAVFVGGVATAATILAILFFRFVGPGDEGSGGGPDPVQ